LPSALGMDSGNYMSVADIHMPAQHTLLGINMTALSEGNMLEQALYGVANSINIPIQYMMGRGVGDGSMRNLNGTTFFLQTTRFTAKTVFFHTITRDNHQLLFCGWHCGWLVLQ